MALGPIPWSSITRYADRAGLDEEEAERLHVIIRLADNDYMRMLNSKTADTDKFRNVADMRDPKAVGRLLDGFENRRKARERRQKR